DFRYEPVAELAVERSKNLDSFAMLTRSLKAISRRNRTSRLFLSSSSVMCAIFSHNQLSGGAFPFENKPQMNGD
ncbi:MAG: hypothetical protein IKS40_06535, partial [Treponema sp.]|nr:hypothetical protein [Treponema sp.]